MCDYSEKYKMHELTPVQEIGGMLFKRDDLYMPFDDVKLSGGKVRQCISLIGNNQKYIAEQCGGLVVTATSVNSPQGLIVSRVAKEFGFNSCIYVGNTNMSSVKRNKMLAQVLAIGGDINCECGSAYENVLSYHINKRRESGDKFFRVKFGINLDDNPGALIDSVARQVQNLPRDLDCLVIPCGSGITMGGILRGLIEYDIHPKRVVGIQISGIDQTQTIERILGGAHFDYELIVDRTYPYSKRVGVNLVPGIQLDPIYEGKAMDYLLREMRSEIEDKKVCFWVVGNSNIVRNAKL